MNITEIKTEIKKLQAKRRRCDFLPDAIIIGKKIDALKKQLKTN